MKENRTPKILITAPSLDESVNVSGISTVVRQIVARGSFDYRHFAAGRADGETANALWIARQAALPLRFYRALKAERADVAHVNTALNPLSIVRDFALVAAARRARTPVLLHVHGGKYLAREFDRKWLAGVAGKMLRAADAVVVLSGLEREIVARRWPGLDPEVLENAVAPEAYPRLEKKKNSLIYLGRLHESKGLAEIAEALGALAAENPDFTFRAFGAGPEAEVFTSAMRRALGERFYFGGVAGEATKRSELAASDIFLLPSRYGEGLPMALLEAMAAGCVAVVSEMASIGAVVADGRNGLTIEPGNARQLTDKLRALLASEANRDELRENARRTIAANFNLRDYIERLETLYARLAKF